MVGRIGPEIRHTVRFGDRSTGGGNFGSNAGHPIVTNGEFAASRPVSKLLWDIVLVVLALCCRRVILRSHVCLSAVYISAILSCRLGSLLHQLQVYWCYVELGMLMQRLRRILYLCGIQRRQQQNRSFAPIARILLLVVQKRRFGGRKSLSGVQRPSTVGV